MSKTIRKSIVIKKLGRGVSDKITVNGEPFEILKGFDKGTKQNEAMRVAIDLQKERGTATHKPYYAIGMWHGEADGIYQHRWAWINKSTNKLEEFD